MSYRCSFAETLSVLFWRCTCLKCIRVAHATSTGVDHHLIEFTIPAHLLHLIHRLSPRVENAIPCAMQHRSVSVDPPDYLVYALNNFLASWGLTQAVWGVFLLVEDLYQGDPVS